MGFFGTKGNECWICRRKTSPEGQFLTNDELQIIFEDVFEDFDSSSLKNQCLCQICAGILKYTSQDSVKARIKISETSEKVKERLGAAANALKDKFKRS